MYFTAINHHKIIGVDYIAFFIFDFYKDRIAFIKKHQGEFVKLVIVGGFDGDGWA